MMLGVSETEEHFSLSATVSIKNYSTSQKGSLKRFFDFTKLYKNDTLFGKIDFIKLFDHPVTAQKKKTFNHIMCPFMFLFKKIEKKKLKENEANKNVIDCPFYQPSSQNTFLRTLFSALKGRFICFPWTLNDFSYTGGFVSVITQLYQARQIKYEVSMNSFF